MNTYQKTVKKLFTLGIFLFTVNLLSGQTFFIRDFVIYSGTGVSQVGSSITINGGKVGSDMLVQSTGSTVFNTDIHSRNKVTLTNSNTVNGKITAANQLGVPGNILSVGSNAVLTGSIDVNGDISVGGGTVSGVVTIPVGNNYSGPAATVNYGAPALPTLPSLPAITSFTPIPAGATNITNNFTASPGGVYGDVTLGSNRTLTLDGPGEYNFRSFNFSGNSTKIVFDFKNQATGNFIIYVHGDADMGKLNASTLRGGDAGRIYFEVHGNGSTSSVPGYSVIIANGSSGGGSKALGTFWAPYGGINIGSGTGSSQLTGAFYSASDVIIQSGVTIEYAPFGTCPVANAGPDQSLCIITASATLAANNPSGSTGTWSVVSGPSLSATQFSNVNTYNATFTPDGGAGAYNLRWSLFNSFCGTSTDDVVINFTQSPTTANAGPDQTDNTTCGLTSVTLAGNTPTVGTGAWSVVTGSGGSFGDATSPTSSFTGTPGTTYTLRWTITNSPCGSSTDDVQVKLNLNPQNVSAGSDIALDFNAQAILTGSTTTAGATHLWTTTNPGNPIITDPTQLSITVNTQGTYIFTVTSSEGCSVNDQADATAAVPSKIGSELKSVFDNFDPSNPDVDNPFYTITDDGYIMIEIASFDGERANVLAEISQSAASGFGFRNEIPNGTDPYWITGQFPIWNLPNLNNVDGINWVRPYYFPDINVGKITSAGDTTMRSHFVKSGYEIDGTDVTVCVISDSYDAITETMTIPPDTLNTTIYSQDISGTNKDLSPVQLVGPDVKTFNFPKLSDEGRAMLQIVMDVAPGVDLKFRTGILTARDMADGIRELRDEGCEVIVDDVTWSYEPFFKDGVVAQAVDEVTSPAGGNVKYFTSGGNFGMKSYEKAFNPKAADIIGFPGKTAHDFSGSNNFFQPIRLAPGNYFFVFQWDDNNYTIEDNGANNDLQIYLTQNVDGSGLIGYNRDNTGGDAIEFIPITVSGSVPVDYNVLIINNTSTPGVAPPARVKYVVFRGDPTFLDYNEGNSTIVGHANSVGAMTVGATRFNHVPGHPLLPDALSGITKPEIETFSSVGGTVVRISETETTVREKPDFTAPDGVNTTVKLGLGQDYPYSAKDGFPNFFGTSAAAPHAAGVAALIIEGKKKFIPGTTIVPPADIRTLLQSTAVDMTETAGFDFISGYGLIDADSAMRTFASPKPHQIELEVLDENIIPCSGQLFTLKIIGENFNFNSEVRLRFSETDSIVLTYPASITSITPTEIIVDIPATCNGNPTVVVYTPSKDGTNGTDGGFSNELNFFTAYVQVIADNKNILWGEPIPALTYTIIIDDTIIIDKGVPTGLLERDIDLTDLGLTDLSITTDATASSNAGLYDIDVAFGTPPTPQMLSDFNYSFVQGDLTISKLHVTVTAENITVVYGDPIPNIQFDYTLEDNDILDETAFINSLSSEHQSQIARDGEGNDVFGLINKTAVAIINNVAVPIINGTAVIIINGIAYTIVNNIAYPIINSKALTIINASEEIVNVNINGTPQALTIINGIVDSINTDGLSSDQINNTSFTATETSLATPRIFNNQSFIDISQEAVDDLKDDNGASIANMMSAVPNSASFGVVDRESYLNGQAYSIINGNESNLVDVTVNGVTQSVTIINQVAVAIINKVAYPIINGVAYTIINNVAVPIINTRAYTIINGVGAVPIINGAAFPIINGAAFTIINGVGAVPIINSDANTGVVISEDEPTGFSNLKSLNTITGLEAGIQDILPGAYTNNSNILVTYIPGKLTITPAPLEIKADSKIKFYGDENPPLTATVTGFKLGETIETSDLTGGPLTLTTAVTKTTPVGIYPINVTQNFSSDNYTITYVNGTMTVNNNPCLLTHSEFKNFGNTPVQPVSLWVTVNTKVRGRLVNHGDYLLFRSPTITLNKIDPATTNAPLYDGIIIADAGTLSPVTRFDYVNNRWETKVPPGYSTTADVFLSGGIVNSNTGFVKANGNTSSTLKGIFESNVVFSDQWAYSIAAYSPQFILGDIDGVGEVVSVSADNPYKAGTPIPVKDNVVSGGSGGGGNNYTGSNSAYDNYTACTTVDNASSSSELITARPVAESTGQADAGTGVQLFPNPASGKVTVSFVPHTSGKSRIIISGIDGRKMMDIELGMLDTGQRYVNQFSISNLQNGIYLVQIFNGESVKSKKLVVIH